MRKMIVVVASLLLLLPTSAYAEAPIPAGDVSCSLTNTGVNYGVSMTFTGGSVSIGNLTYDWEYAMLNAGASPAQTSNYGTRQLFRSTNGNGLDMSYEELLSLASGNSNGTILVFAIPKNTVGNSVISNRTGKGCYVDLPTIFNNKASAAKIEVEKAAAAKIEADKLAVAKVESDKVATESSGLAIQKQSDFLAKTKMLSKKYPVLAGNIMKLSGAIGPIPPATSAQDLQRWLVQIDQLNATLDSWTAKLMSSQKTVITCTKGKLIKKVTGQNPKCPAGYKSK